MRFGVGWKGLGGVFGAAGSEARDESGYSKLETFRHPSLLSSVIVFLRSQRNDSTVVLEKNVWFIYIGESIA